MNFNIYNSLILTGVIHGFFFGLVVLSSKKYRAKSNYFLVALILVYSLNNLQYYLLDTGTVTVTQFYSYLYIQWAMLMPVFLYLYGLTFLYPEVKITWRLKLLYLPFLMGLTLSITFKLLVALYYHDPNFSPFFQSLPFYGEFIAVVFTLAVIAVLFIKIFRFEKRQTYSAHRVPYRLSWLKATLVILFIGTLLWAYSEYTYGDQLENFYFYPLWILVAFVIYWLGHIGIYKYGVLEQRKRIRRISHEVGPRITVEKTRNEHLLQIEKLLVEEKNFLDTSLSLESLAEKMELSKGYLSKIINTELGMNFKEYLNKLRIEEAKSYLINPEFANYTLVAIGLEAGFNSKSAFNATFKKVTSITPSEYKKQHGN